MKADLEKTVSYWKLLRESYRNGPRPIPASHKRTILQLSKNIRKLEKARARRKEQDAAALGEYEARCRRPTPAEIATNDAETLARHYPDPSS